MPRGYAQKWKVIGLDERNARLFATYVSNLEGGYERYGTPKSLGEIVPFIDAGNYGRITPEAKKSLVDLLRDKRKIRKIVNQMSEVNL